MLLLSFRLWQAFLLVQVAIAVVL
jgi:hypothetical protein